MNASKGSFAKDGSNITSGSKEMDWLDGRAREIEIALNKYQRLDLRHLVEEIVYRRTSLQNINIEGARKVKSIALYWEIRYRDDMLEYPDNLDDWKRYCVDYNCTNGAKAKDESEF